MPVQRYALLKVALIMLCCRPVQAAGGVRLFVKPDGNGRADGRSHSSALVTVSKALAMAAKARAAC